jgi:Cytochrome c554 and c-prime
MASEGQQLRSPSRVLRWIFVGLACLPIAAAAQQAEVSCAKCHVQARTQPFTQMSTALQPAGANPVLKAHPTLTGKKGIYTYTIETHGDKTMYSVSDGVSTVSYPVTWGFGAANQTWVYERNGRYYESLMSYYTLINGLGTTTGDEGLTPHTVEEAAGRLLPHGDIVDCLGCHSTGSSSNGKFTPAALHPGVQCEQCHQGTAAHLADELKGKQDLIPADLSAMSAEETSAFCGRCHRTWEKVMRLRTKGEVNSRFPAFRIANSRCFDGTDPRISCVACHDVHKPLEQSESFYDSKCLACHTTTVKAGALAPPPDAKICPVAKSKCASCHMPKVTLPSGFLVFTDHQIRVVKPGEPFPN